MSELKPREVVEELDRYIIGQKKAKRAVAIALRNRWRRHRIPEKMRAEVNPKNILMIGPTGVGKTEIARRIARLTSAPFVKVEATKFTEVGFHGRDVDQIIRDLVDVSITMTKKRMQERMKNEINLAVEEHILDVLTGKDASENTRTSFRQMLREGLLEDRYIEIEVPERSPLGGQTIGIGGNPGGIPIGDIFMRANKMFGLRNTKKKRMKISESRPLLEELESENLVSDEDVQREAIQTAEQDGIVFIDEIDKIATRSDRRYGGDASSEGVQRDLLPIIEGSTVHTKHGNVSTNHILFIASGAFHSCKPSDLMAELQGRLPIRVELSALEEDDLYRILTEPEFSLLKQQRELLRTEGVDLDFTEAALRRIVAVAAEVNETIENIGARRLHTVLERIMEDISFNAPDMKGDKVIVDVDTVDKTVGDMLLKTDLSKKLASMWCWETSLRRPRASCRMWVLVHRFFTDIHA